MAIPVLFPGMDYGLARPTRAGLLLSDSEGFPFSGAQCEFVFVAEGGRRRHEATARIYVTG